LNLLDKKVLEESNTYIRLGVSRTDISSLVGFVNETYEVNAWKEKEYMQKIVTDLETPKIVKKRLETAYSVLGDRIKYASPDCGLAFWPDQELAFKHCLRIPQKVSMNLMQKKFNAEKKTEN